jgi:hypothetical protein
MPKPPETYRTPSRTHGPRSGDTDPRPGEDPARGGQKEYAGDPDGMKPTEEIPAGKRRQPGAEFHQPIRGNEPTSEGKTAGDAKLRGEDRTAFKTRA